MDSESARSRPCGAATTAARASCPFTSGGVALMAASMPRLSDTTPLSSRLRRRRREEGGGERRRGEKGGEGRRRD